MADEQNNDQNAQGSGELPDAGLGDGVKTFNQAEVDRLLGERASRERAKFSDYADLKAKATKYQEYEDAQKSELEREREARVTAETTAKAAMDRANQRLIRAEFVAKAALLGAAHPEDAYALADKTAIQQGDDGTVTGVSDAVKALVEAGRLPVTGRQRAPNLDGGAGGGDRSGDGKIKATPEQEAIARKMGLPLEQYIKYVPK